MGKTLDERFWAKVDKTGNCWLWTAAKTKGYGTFCLSSRPTIQFYAHRLAYEMLVGPIPKGMHVLHKCDTPACVNPEHFYLGGNIENSADKVARGRQSRGSHRPLAKLTEADIPLIRNDTRFQRIIAAEYGVTQSIISEIKAGRAWSWV